MKQLMILLAAVFTLTFSYTYAQRTTSTYLDLFVNATNSNLNYGASNSTLKDYKKPLKGIQAGASFQAGINRSFSLVSELYYIRKGGKLQNGNPLTNVESSIRLHNIEMPVLARLHLRKFYLNAGPSLGYTISGKEKSGDKTQNVSFANTPEGFNRFNASIHAGGGIGFMVKQKRLALDIRYTHGVTNISRRDEIYNRAVMVSVLFSKPWKTNPLAKR